MIAYMNSYMSLSQQEKSIVSTVVLFPAVDTSILLILIGWPDA